MGGSIGTHSTAAAVPLSSEVRQKGFAEPCLVKILKDVSDLFSLI